MGNYLNTADTNLLAGAENMSKAIIDKLVNNQQVCFGLEIIPAVKNI
jgi:hypothetical protein